MYHGAISYRAETVGQLVDSVLPYFDPSVQLACVQYEYNHKQTVYGTCTIRSMLLHRTRSGTIISCLLCSLPTTRVIAYSL